MGFVGYVIFFLICVVAVYPLVTAQRADGDAMMARMSPFVGIIGVIAIFLGVIGAFQLVRVLGAALSSFHGILMVVMVVIEILLGILLAWPLISKYVLKGSEAPQKLAAIQIPLGIVGIAVFAGLLAL